MPLVDEPAVQLYSCVLDTLEFSVDNILHSVILVITLLMVNVTILHNQ